VIFFSFLQGRRLVVFTAPRTDGKPGPLVITCHHQKLHHPTRQVNPTEGQAGEVTAVKKEQVATLEEQSAGGM
jgi:hypothetical protein